MKNTYVCPVCNHEFMWDDSLNETMTRCPKCNEEMLAPRALLAKGAKVGDYEIIQRIGIGGMGEVYLATQKSMERNVALKILHNDLISDQVYLQRFLREVRTLASIEHPNIVRAIEAGSDGSIHYFSMTYVDGNDLKRLLDDGKVFKEREALIIIRQIAGALSYVWEKHKLLHRDIKPANIMITSSGEVELMDLGISKKISENNDLTLAGMMVGSPNYVSPEQAKAGKDIDFRADMYSLGATLYHMLTGETPYSGDNAVAIIASHLSDPIPDPRDKTPEMSTATSELVKKMMAKSKAGRYPSWDEVIKTIDKILGKLPDNETSERFSVSDTNSMMEEKKVFSQSAIIRHRIRRRILLNSPLKVAILIILFIVFGLGLILVLVSSVKENKRKKSESIYNEAIQLIDEQPDNRKNFKEILIKLENVQKMGDTKYKILAREKIQQIIDRARKLKDEDDKQIKTREVEEVRKKAYQLQKDGKIDDAISVIENYMTKGPFSKDPEIQSTFKREVEYLKRQKEKEESGL